MHLRMDDTNPEKEELSHEHAIVACLNDMGIPWHGDVRYASDHFVAMHDAANMLIREGLAYIDTSDKDTMRKMRGDLYKGGTKSTDFTKPLEWHLDMFARMTSGAFEDGAMVLRANIDMGSPNINLRDPVLYRIKHMAHARTKNLWCVYPAYDYAHPFCDVAEGIALSLCTLEFEDHRPLYDWVCERVRPLYLDRSAHKPIELEFSRLEITKGLTSKRKINAFVSEGKVDGYDDPRLLTLEALRRRGFSPNVIFKFIEDCGVSRNNSEVPFSRLEDTMRLELDSTATRRIVVLDPVALDIDDFPDSSTDLLINNHPKDLSLGTRSFGLSSKVWIERSDIRLPNTAEKGFKRIEIGAIVRLMNIGIVECTAIDTEDGRITRVHARLLESGKARATIHALSRAHSVCVDVLEPTCIGPEDDPENCLRTYRAVVEPCTMHTSGTFHAIRVGYMVVDNKNTERLILSTRLKNNF